MANDVQYMVYDVWSVYNEWCITKAMLCKGE